MQPHATLAALLILCATAGAQAPHQEGDPLPTRAAQAEDTDARPLRRILHLRGGTTLRAVTRRTADAWEYRRSGGWRPIPLAGVERAVLEKDALRDFRKQRRAAGEDPDAQAALARWALESGLLEEALGILERVLDADPEHEAAREALIAHALRFQTPSVDPRSKDVAASTDELRRWAAGRGTTARELAILELARVRERDGLRELFGRELFVHSVGRRAFAAHALRRLFPGEEVKPLLHRAVLDTSEEVRRGACLALRRTGKEGVIAPVVRAMGSSHPRVRAQAAQALGNLGFPAAVEPLIGRLASAQGGSGHRVPHSHIFTGRQFAFVQDFDVEVAMFQAVADPQVNVLVEGSVLDAGVHGVKEVGYATESRAIRRSLEQLTGVDPGSTNRAWLGWWKRDGERWRAEQRAGEGSGVGSQ